MSDTNYRGILYALDGEWVKVITQESAIWLDMAYASSKDFTCL